MGVRVDLRTEARNGRWISIAEVASIHPCSAVGTVCRWDRFQRVACQPSGLVLEVLAAEVDTWTKSGEADVSNGVSLNERFGDSTKQERWDMARADLLKQLFRAYRDSDRESFMAAAGLSLTKSARNIILHSPMNCFEY